MKERCVQGFPPLTCALNVSPGKDIGFMGEERGFPAVWNWVWPVVDLDSTCLIFWFVSSWGLSLRLQLWFLGEKKKLFPKKVNGAWCWNSKPSTKVVGRLSSIGADGENPVQSTVRKLWEDSARFGLMERFWWSCLLVICLLPSQSRTPATSCLTQPFRRPESPTFTSI